MDTSSDVAVLTRFFKGSTPTGDWLKEVKALTTEERKELADAVREQQGQAAA